jgi:hypothetical protein
MAFQSKLLWKPWKVRCNNMLLVARPSRRAAPCVGNNLVWNQFNSNPSNLDDKWAALKSPHAEHYILQDSACEEALRKKEFEEQHKAFKANRRVSAKALPLCACCSQRVSQVGPSISWIFCKHAILHDMSQDGLMLHDGAVGARVCHPWVENPPKYEEDFVCAALNLVAPQFCCSVARALLGRGFSFEHRIRST